MHPCLAHLGTLLVAASLFVAHDATALGSRGDLIAAAGAFAAAWQLPLEVEAGNLRVMRSRTAPISGVVRDLSIDRNAFGVSTDGSVVMFRAGGPWKKSCTNSPSSKDLTPAQLLASHTSAITRTWRRKARAVRGTSWTPDLETDQGYVDALLRETSELVDGKIAYRNFVRATFDSGRCLVRLLASNVVVLKDARAAIAKTTALSKLNKALTRSGMHASDAVLEVRFLSQRAVLVWVPVQALDDIEVEASIWVDAQTGELYRARDDGGR